MSDVLIHSHEGLPLHLLEKAQYEGWLERQPDATKQWLAATGFSGNGVSTIAGDGGMRAKAIAALPFILTDGQKTALTEITGDMSSDTRMLRLLQGDVGSGKTVVALLAMLVAVEAGAQ
ncbi:MAG: hypothetical protein VW258_16570, partial [Thalassolituus sp.]